MTSQFITKVLKNKRCRQLSPYWLQEAIKRSRPLVSVSQQVAQVQKENNRYTHTLLLHSMSNRWDVLMADRPLSGKVSETTLCRLTGLQVGNVTSRIK